MWQQPGASAEWPELLWAELAVSVEPAGAEVSAALALRAERELVVPEEVWESAVAQLERALVPEVPEAAGWVVPYLVRGLNWEWCCPAMSVRRLVQNQELEAVALGRLQAAVALARLPAETAAAC